jgi:uncharacterized repeat protein (TIGR03803 family)
MLKRCWPLGLLASVASCVLAFPALSDAAPTVLYTFSAPQSTPATNDDGFAPASKLVLADGYLYGTASHGGTNGAGAIFRLALTGGFSTLYSFAAATNNSGEVVYDLGPNDLTPGADGNFYGTTRRGGSNFTGTIFVLSPAGSFSTLHTFAAETVNSSGRATSADGATPTGALVQGSDGDFYGTTQNGGANGGGAIFKISSGGAFASLYSFSALSAGSVSTNAAVPNALLLARDGAFYGTTQQGGVGGAGTFFKYAASGGFTQIYSFNGSSPSNNPITPDVALVQGANGNFYGTSAFGGAQGGGCVFAITNTGGVTLLHSFPQLQAGAGATLALGADGNFYGTTAANRLKSEGTFFRMSPTGDAFGAYTFSPLDTKSANADGANPSGGLTADSSGNLYGTCEDGGTNGSGLIFVIYGTGFNPPSFRSTSNLPPAVTNVAEGAPVTLSYSAQGAAPVSYQWLRNGSNIADGGGFSGSLTNVLAISSVLPADAGSYALVVSNNSGALTSAVTVLTIEPPGISITSPKANARTNALAFAGMATNAPLFAGANPGENRLTNVTFSITNLLNGANVAGTATLTAGSGGVSNWSFTATPPPGTNTLFVQCEDASGNVSPTSSRTFFYEVPVSLTVRVTGSGTGSFNLTNGEMLDLGESYSITARPKASVFSHWTAGGVTSSAPTLPFVMGSNLILTANFLARQAPAVSIASPPANARTAAPVFSGTAQSSPVLPGVDPNNVRLDTVRYWLTNSAASSVLSGAAALTGGLAVSNWSFTVNPLPGTNTLAVQSHDVSGGVSSMVTRTFFYEKPVVFTLLKAGNGNGSFKAASSVSGDTVPTNGAMLNAGQSYTITAVPDQSSTFGRWISSSGAASNQATFSFIMEPGFALTATFLEIPPVVAISSPAANLRTAAIPVFKGTASGHFPITNVFCTLGNTNGSATLSAGSGTVSNWSVALVPAPGENTLTAFCVDAHGNPSATVSHKFFYEVPARLSVLKAGAGNGSFNGPADGTLLDIGETYKITAVPDTSSLFSNWVSSAGAGGGVAGDSPVLSFVMQSNLVLTATFATNFYAAAAGSYNGLFYRSAAVSEETSGMVENLVLQKTGVFSGKLLTAGTNYHLAARLDASGRAAFPVGPLQLALALDSAALRITGTVAGSTWMSDLTADLAANVLPSAEYTLLFSPTANVSTNSPPGDGYALVASHAGMVTLSGALADGTRYNESVPVSRAGDVPVYASLTNNGLFLGWINLTNLQAAAPANTLTWIKARAPSPARYTNGFAHVLSVAGGVWEYPPAISLTGGTLILSNTAFLLDFTNVAVSGNALRNLGPFPTNSLTGSINPRTGLLTLVFDNGNGHATNIAWAALVQNTTNAGGFFLTPTNAGAVTLRPN